MFNLILTTPVSIFISLAALAGVTLHDTKLDRLATSFSGIPAIMSNTEAGSKGITGDQHTHVERVSLKDVSSSEPRLVPRYGEQKKHVLQKNVTKGHHVFDGYSLSIT